MRLCFVLKIIDNLVQTEVELVVLNWFTDMLHKFLVTLTNKTFNLAIWKKSLQKTAQEKQQRTGPFLTDSYQCQLWTLNIREKAVQ